MLIYRQNASQLIQNVILAFAFTVIGIRLFLEFSPITIIVVGTFHLAHMLWGGLILLIAALLMFTFQNKKITEISSWLTGIGFGFFIDEIGKYISTTNDYYYKLAAPLIYLSFLITVFTWFFVRRNQKPDLFEKLYYAIDDLKNILENRLYRSEFKQMKKTFKHVLLESEDPTQREIAENLLELLPDLRAHVKHDRRSKVSDLHLKVRQVGRELFQRKFIRAVFYTGFVVRIGWIIPSILLPMIGFSEDTNFDILQTYLISSGLITGNKELYPFLFMLIMEIAVAIGLLFGLSLMLLKRRGGVWLVRRLLLFSILFLAVFNVYFGQFSALIAVVIDAFLLFIITKLHRPVVAPATRMK